MAKPFTYIFDNFGISSLGEDALNFLKISGDASYEAVVNSKKLIAASVTGGRLSPNTISLKPLTVTYGGNTYSLSKEFDLLGRVISLNSFDPVSHVAINVITKDGVLSGNVLDAQARLIGTVSAFLGDLRIQYIDGSRQAL